MCTLLVKHFGPIINDEEVIIEPKKITVLSGKQGSGKSTIAKLFSEFSWLEKALVRGDFTIKQLTRKGTFVKTHCSFHNIQNYFQPSTYIKYVGDKYSFSFAEGVLSVTEIETGSYIRPQIMYIPAERNFMTAIEHAEKIKNLPRNLHELQVEYDKSLKSLKSIEVLPIEGYSVSQDQLNNITWLRKGNCKIRIPEAASGFQSLVPMVLVSRYLQNTIQDNESNNAKSEDSSEETQKYVAMLQKIINDKQIDDNTKAILIRRVANLRKNRRFVNIIEEMEQNLFPSSQRSVLYELLSLNNSTEGNRLFLTTHSPYVISYISLTVKAKAVYDKVCNEKLKLKIQELVPQKAMLGPDDAVFYEVNDNGTISILPTYKGMPDDDNMLNVALGDLGDIYEELVDIEGLCKK